LLFPFFGLPFAALAEEGVTDTTIRIGQWVPRQVLLLPGELWPVEQESISNDQ